MTRCVFCEILDKKHDAELIVYEDKYVIGLISLQQKPGNHGHVLVLPRRHVPHLYDLPNELHAPLLAEVQQLARATKAAFAADGIQLRQNNEAAAGQDVFHMHVHVVPRFVGDEFDAKKYERLPLETRREIAGRLKAILSSPHPTAANSLRS